MTTQRAIMCSIVAWLAISAGGGGTALGHGDPYDAFWTGNGASNSWHDPANWDVNDVPCTYAANVHVLETQSAFLPLLISDCYVRSLEIGPDTALSLADGVDLAFSAGSEGGASIQVDGLIELLGTTEGASLTLIMDTALSGSGSIAAGPSAGNVISFDTETTLAVESGAWISIVPADNVLPGEVGLFTIEGPSSSSFEGSTGLDNAGTLEALGSVHATLKLSDWYLAPASFNSGALRAQSGGTFSVVNGVLDNTNGELVAMDNAVFDVRDTSIVNPAFITDVTSTIRVPNGSVTTLIGDLHLDGNLALESQGEGADVQFDGSTTLTGDATITTTALSANRFLGIEAEVEEPADSQLTIASDASLTVTPAASVEPGAFGRMNMGGGLLTLVNNGAFTVSGDQFVAVAVIQGANDGLVRIDDGATTSIVQGSFTGDGLWQIDGGHLHVNTTSLDPAGSIELANDGLLTIDVGADWAAHDVSADESSALSLKFAAILYAHGNFSFAMHGGEGWAFDSTATLTMAGAALDVCDPATYPALEVGGPDYLLPRLVIASGATVRLVDEFVNSPGGGIESLHVGTLEFEDASSRLDLNGIELVAENIVGQHDCSFMECAGGVEEADPLAGAIDARQPISPVDGSPIGWSGFDLKICAIADTLEPGDFIIDEVGGDGVPPTIASFELLSDDVVRVVLDGPVEPITWTTITYVPTGEPASWGYLPADASGDGVSGPADVLHLIDCLAVGGDCPSYSTDIDRSGAAGPADVLRLIDLLNGADAFDAYNGASLPPLP